MSEPQSLIGDPLDEAKSLSAQEIEKNLANLANKDYAQNFLYIIQK